MNVRSLTAVLVLLVLAAPAARGATYPYGGSRSTDNDDTCDIALLPAATLLLPHFEVDISARGRATTRFTVTNVSHVEQAARVTLWTDYAFPVIELTIFLTGYDTQAIDLYDVIGLGQFAPPRGTGFEDTGSPEGDFASDSANPLVDQESCRNLAVDVGPQYRLRLQQAFTLGKVPQSGPAPACDAVGSAHVLATGYATIDVTANCGTLNPEDPRYYTDEILFDNVLTGDYLQLDPAEQKAQAAPLVHIRAVPEGGTFASRAAEPGRFHTNLERTFYSRYHHGLEKRLDARQPLPSTFAARWIAGGPGELRTTYRIWREGIAVPGGGCDTYAVNGEMEVAEIVRFDENENYAAFAAISPIEHTPRLPATSRVDILDEAVFPGLEEDTVAGWVYLNLDDDPADGIASQAWMVSSMGAAGGFSVDADVVALGNGCTPPAPFSAITSAGGPPIGPAPNRHRPREER